ncbi:MAG: hypothetical protein ACX930_05290 [Erythrobacter sp.]
MRFIIILLVVFAIGLGAWFLLRDDGVVEQVTEARVEQVLLANGVPPGMADCMSARLVDRLNINQLRKLERAAPQEGETRVPVSTEDALARIRRVDDDQAVEQVVITATRCGAEALLDRL